MVPIAVQAEDLARILIPFGVAVVAVLLRRGIRAMIRSGSRPSRAVPSPAPKPVGCKPVLRGIAGTYKNTDIPFDGQPITIGRDPSASNLILPQECAAVSSRHCQIKFEQGRFMLEDLWSTNGTFLAGKALQPGKAVELNEGARFHLGDPSNAFEVRFQ